MWTSAARLKAFSANPAQKLLSGITNSMHDAVRSLAYHNSEARISRSARRVLSGYLLSPTQLSPIEIAPQKNPLSGEVEPATKLHFRLRCIHPVRDAATYSDLVSFGLQDHRLIDGLPGWAVPDVADASRERENQLRSYFQALHSVWADKCPLSIMVLEETLPGGEEPLTIAASIVVPLANRGAIQAQYGFGVAAKLTKASMVGKPPLMGDILLDLFVKRPWYLSAGVRAGYHRAGMLKHISMFWNPIKRPDDIKRKIIIEPDNPGFVAICRGLDATEHPRATFGGEQHTFVLDPSEVAHLLSRQDKAPICMDWKLLLGRIDLSSGIPVAPP